MFIVSTRCGDFKRLLFNFANDRYAASKSRRNTNRKELMAHRKLLEYAVNRSPATSLLNF